MMTCFGRTFPTQVFAHPTHLQSNEEEMSVLFIVRLSLNAHAVGNQV